MNLPTPNLGLAALIAALLTLGACTKTTADSSGPNASSQPSASVPNGKFETALLAGGCFWGMEEILRSVPGVVSTDVGYTGGATQSPSYDVVNTGTTVHAESIRIVFDPAKLSY